MENLSELAALGDDLDVTEEVPSYLEDDAPAVPTTEPILPSSTGPIAAAKGKTPARVDEFGLPAAPAST